ncbi:CD209 antigen-like [Branchiostoma floridae x Branchiostoma belcheri]
MPRDSGIDTFLVSLVKASSGNLRSSIGDQQPGRPSRFWFGLSDRHQEGKWEWMDGTALGTGYKGWGEGEPNDAIFPFDDQDCAEYRNGYNSPKGYAWNDTPCSRSHYFICQVAASDAAGK